MLQSFNRLFSNGNKSREETKDFQDDVVQLPVSNVQPNSYQPRTEFNEEKIKELAQTFQTHGIIQPIIVRKTEEEQYELIAGERRLRAAKFLEWETISSIIRDLSDAETASIALIENIQREELSVIEEAQAYKQLIYLHELTQEALAQRLGKSQSTVANRLRLLQLPEEIQVGLMDKQITERHARAMMKLEETLQKEVFEQIVKDKLNVRQTEELIEKLLKKPAEKKKQAKPKMISKDIRIATNTIRESLKMITETGIEVESEEEELDDVYQITIKVKKRNE
ncbi:MAG TPA: nucleoid occlusion protein [Pseudogracilibacillus sp.]|nr:nucleoid occlusion protein [Pseudogracilibacillus sp.]